MIQDSVSKWQPPCYGDLKLPSSFSREKIRKSHRKILEQLYSTWYLVQEEIKEWSGKKRGLHSRKTVPYAHPLSLVSMVSIDGNHCSENHGNLSPMPCFPLMASISALLVQLLFTNLVYILYHCNIVLLFLFCYLFIFWLLLCTFEHFEEFCT